MNYDDTYWKVNWNWTGNLDPYDESSFTQVRLLPVKKRFPLKQQGPCSVFTIPGRYFYVGLLDGKRYENCFTKWKIEQLEKDKSLLPSTKEQFEEQLLEHEMSKHLW